MKSSKGSRKPGYSAEAHFRAQRRRVLRENMRDWLITLALGAGCVAAAVLLDNRAAALIFAGSAGAVAMLCVVEHDISLGDRKPSTHGKSRVRSGTRAAK